MPAIDRSRGRAFRCVDGQTNRYGQIQPSAYVSPEQLVLELSYQATAMPKLYIVTINEALGVFFRDIVARTDQINRPEDPAVHVNQIGSISCHLRLDFSERETVSQRLSEQLIFIKQGARTLMQKQRAGFGWSLVDPVEGL